jgi:pimeloyl-ACP methyl ester carboxylesterase
MGSVSVNGIELAYEVYGEADGLPLVLVGGLGQQLIGWHADLIGAMIDRGYRVIAFDNRDVGLSTHLDHLGEPDLMAILGGSADTLAYRLEDMAADTVGLIDALGLGSVHLLGVSLGGMIAQVVALTNPTRLRSLTLVMSHPGGRTIPPSAEAEAALLRPPPRSREEFVDGAEEASRLIGSPEFAPDIAWVRQRAARVWDRRYNPRGVARQLAAILSAADRTGPLSSLELPTLVVHGQVDPLIPVEGGRRIAAAIPAAELLEIDGMGHDLPRLVWDRILDKLDDVVYRGEAGAGLARAS